MLNKVYQEAKDNCWILRCNKRGIKILERQMHFKLKEFRCGIIFLFFSQQIYLIGLNYQTRKISHLYKLFCALILPKPHLSKWLYVEISFLTHFAWTSKRNWLIHDHVYKLLYIISSLLFTKALIISVMRWRLKFQWIVDFLTVVITDFHFHCLTERKKLADHHTFWIHCKKMQFKYV